MKVAWIGVSRDGSGYSSATNTYMLALDSVGVDVCSRPLKLNNYHDDPPARIKELEKKSFKPDIVIQHTLPPYFDYCGDVPVNIGLYATETSDFIASGWSRHINNLDWAWVINEQSLEASIDSGVKIPIDVVPHAIPMEELSVVHPPLEGLKPYQDEHLFYWIGEFNRRKNLSGVLRAFFYAFAESDPVRLVIKANKPGSSPEELRQELAEYVEAVAANMKLKRFPNISIISERLSDVGMLRLHSSCQTFVSASHGEAANIPAMTAMAMGKTPIVSKWGGFLGYMTESTGWLVEGNLEPAFCADGLPTLYTGRELWFQPSILHLAACMREAFLSPHLRQQKAAEGIKRAYDFDLPAVGLRMKGLLESALHEVSR